MRDSCCAGIGRGIYREIDRSLDRTVEAEMLRPSASAARHSALTALRFEAPICRHCCNASRSTWTCGRPGARALFRSTLRIAHRRDLRSWSQSATNSKICRRELGCGGPCWSAASSTERTNSPSRTSHSRFHTQKSSRRPPCVVHSTMIASASLQVAARSIGSRMTSLSTAGRVGLPKPPWSSKALVWSLNGPGESLRSGRIARLSRLNSLRRRPPRNGGLVSMNSNGSSPQALAAVSRSGSNICSKYFDFRAPRSSISPTGDQ